MKVYQADRVFKSLNVFLYILNTVETYMQCTFFQETNCLINDWQCVQKVINEK